jgi:16S rRNA processing protein RimM
VETNGKILVGKIVAPQGLQGHVRVHAFTERPDDLKTLKIENINLKFIRGVGRDMAVCKIDGANDRNAAEALRGTELFVSRDSLPDLPAGQYYQADLIGMAAEQNGEQIGRVAAMHNFGAGDIIELDTGGMASFAGAEIDFEKRKIILKRQSA